MEEIARLCEHLISIAITPSRGRFDSRDFPPGAVPLGRLESHISQANFSVMWSILSLWTYYILYILPLLANSPSSLDLHWLPGRLFQSDVQAKLALAKFLIKLTGALPVTNALMEWRRLFANVYLWTGDDTMREFKLWESRVRLYFVLGFRRIDSKLLVSSLFASQSLKFCSFEVLHEFISLNL